MSTPTETPDTATEFWSAGWYRRNYPNGPEYDPRLFAVLGTWRALYNINRTGQHRLDGGFRRCDNGLEIRLPYGQSLATYDDDGLTALVVAAHRYQCRVEFSAAKSLLVIRIHPRDPNGERFYDKHPDLAALAKLAGAGDDPSE